MSVRAAPLNTAAADLGTAIAEVQPEAAALAEGNSFSTQSQSAPLTRNIVVSIRASLNDLCLQKSKGTWAPSPEALKSIFQAKKFVTNAIKPGGENQGLAGLKLCNSHPTVGLESPPERKASSRATGLMFGLLEKRGMQKEK